MGNAKSCAFMSAVATLYPEGSMPQHSCPSSSSCKVPMPSSEVFSELSGLDIDGPLMDENFMVASSHTLSNYESLH